MSKPGTFVIAIITLMFVWDTTSTIAQTKQPERQADRESVDLYFPPATGAWESVAPKSPGWNKAKLMKALDFAGEKNSSGVVILKDGKLLAEKYWNPKQTLRYRAMQHGVDDQNRRIEDVASVQKSISSVLLSVAIHKGLVRIEDPVDKHLGKGWSDATRKQESGIKIKHLISMTTGLSDSLQFKFPAGENWRYNTKAYSRILNVMEAASGLDRHEMSKQWLTDAIGMKDSTWVERQFGKADPKSKQRAFGFVTTARDLARFGLLVQADGVWDGKTILENKEYLEQMRNPSQKLNPSYGFLWWLNGQAFTLRGTRRVNGSRNKSAPDDMIAALGALGRKVYIVPSMGIVVVRLGNDPGAKFDEEFWKLLMKASGK